MHVHARACNPAERRAPPGDPRPARPGRQGRGGPARRGARSFRGHRPARPARAGGAGARTAGPRRRTAAAPQPGSFTHRRETYTEEKAAVARAAVDVLRDARVIVLDGSTTNLELARRLPADRTCTVLTNSPPIAAALAEHPAAEVVMIGGRLDKRAQVTVGAAAIDFLRSIRADACVLGVCALHPEAGLSTDDLEEAHVKRAMVEASADVVALATSDKLRAASAYLVAPVTELTHVVAEAGAPDELLDPYRAIGVTVTRA